MKARVFLEAGDESEVLEMAAVPRAREVIIRDGKQFEVEAVEHTPAEEIKVGVKVVGGSARLIA